MQSKLFPKCLCFSFALFSPCILSLLIPAYTTCKAAVEKSFRSPLSIARAVFVRRLVRRLVRRRLVRRRLVRKLIHRLVVLVLTFPRWPIKACNPSCLCALFWVLLTFVYFSIFLSFYMLICLFTFLSNTCFVLLLFYL
jgi:hypothetical protein